MKCSWIHRSNLVVELVRCFILNGCGDFACLMDRHLFYVCMCNASECVLCGSMNLLFPQLRLMGTRLDRLCLECKYNGTPLIASNCNVRNKGGKVLFGRYSCIHNPTTDKRSAMFLYLLQKRNSDEVTYLVNNIPMKQNI
jgi:hypothetical protein